MRLISNQSFSAQPTRQLLIFKWRPEIVHCHFLMKNLHHRGWHGSALSFAYVAKLRHKNFRSKREIIHRRKNLRYNPHPIGRTSVAQFGLVLVVLHEAFAGRMVIDNCYVLLLIWLQHCNIDFDECLILPQRAGISSVQSHFNCYRLFYYTHERSIERRKII